MAESTWQDLAKQFPVAPEEIEFEVEVKEEEEPISSKTLGLLYVGHLIDSFEIFGSKVSIRTLKIGEELEAELLVSKYRNTQEENRAYMTALVAACITSVDGRPLIQALGPDGETLERKFNFITSNWHWITIAGIYDHYRVLVEQVMDSLEEVKKK